MTTFADAAEEADAACLSISGHCPSCNIPLPQTLWIGKPESQKSLINFDFPQKLGKVLMTVIAVMPAAGLMISVGKLIQMADGDMGAVLTIGSTMETIG